eukprot:4831221-Alexandrium_andersonii.AAC.1
MHKYMHTHPRKWSPRSSTRTTALHQGATINNNRATAVGVSASVHVDAMSTACAVHQVRCQFEGNVGSAWEDG